MKSNKIIIYLLSIFVMLVIIPLNVRALLITETEPVVNSFTLGLSASSTYTYTLEYVNGDSETLGTRTINPYVGSTVTLEPPTVSVTGYTLDRITIDGSGNYSIGDTFVQPNNNVNIEYVYKAPARTFNVNYTGDTNYYNPNGGSTATEGGTYTSRITFTRNLDTIRITMGGRTLVENTDYSYTASGNNGINLTIPNVSGNITINITTTTSGGGGICLVEGTKITLWDGSTKNIEDITYDTLLKVWNHDLGTYGYEYPSWIEKEDVSDSYTKVSFSDGTVLKIVGNHSIFSKTKNKYVDINSDEFNVGDEVVKLTNGISYVTVTNIEEVQEKVKYYHVISSRYFNIIANDFLTTYEIFNNISNFMGFGENLVWQIKDVVRSDMYTFEEFPFVFKYFFKTFRLQEAKYVLVNNIVSMDEFQYLFNMYLMNDERKVTPPKDISNNRLWMVTTSDDTDPDDISHRMVEGSSYTIPTPNNTEGFLYWYNHSDNKHYQPGEVIEVDSSIYLEAIYE